MRGPFNRTSIIEVLGVIVRSNPLKWSRTWGNASGGAGQWRLHPESLRENASGVDRSMTTSLKCAAHRSTSPTAPGKPLPTYCQNITKKMPKRCQNVTKPLPKRYHNVAKTLPRHSRCIVKTLPKQCQRIDEALFAHCITASYSMSFASWHLTSWISSTLE